MWNSSKMVQQIYCEVLLDRRIIFHYSLNTWSTFPTWKYNPCGQLIASFNEICCNYGQFCSSSQRHVYKEMKSALTYWHYPDPFFTVYPRRFWTEGLTRLLWPRQIVCYFCGPVAYLSSIYFRTFNKPYFDVWTLEKY